MNNHSSVRPRQMQCWHRLVCLNVWNEESLFALNNSNVCHSVKCCATNTGEEKRKPRVTTKVTGHRRHVCWWGKTWMGVGPCCSVQRSWYDWIIYCITHDDMGWMLQNWPPLSGVKVSRAVVCLLHAWGRGQINVRNFKLIPTLCLIWI